MQTQPVSKVPKTKVVDTRKATNVNLDKYDEKLQDLAERSSGGMRGMEQNKEKTPQQVAQENGIDLSQFMK